MSADDQVFLDVLSSLPNQIQRYSRDVADYVDQNVDKVAAQVRDALASTPWIKDYIKLSSPAPPPPAVPLTALEKVQGWVSRNRLLTGVVVLASGAVVYHVYRSSRFCRKTRRARRARNGGRVEVVVVAGSPNLPLTRSLSLDLERRGFIVYVVCSAAEDETAVQGLSRPDIRPLVMDITDPPSASVALEHFAQYLQTPHSPAPRTKPNYLALKAVILIPSVDYQTSPIATIPPSSFADLFNTHLLHPILTIQAFLPLLTTRLAPAAGERWTAPKVLVLTPSIISAINPPFHAPEATVCSALAAFTEVLAAELRPLAIPVTHFQLGTFDFSGFAPARPHAHAGLLLAPGPDRDARDAPAPAAAGPASAVAGSRVRGLRGSSLRRLHCAVFDAIDGGPAASVVRVGLGAGVYGFVGRWAPRGLVAWMVGAREPAGGGGSEDGSEEGRPASEASDGQDFVAVPAEGGANVWR